MVVFAEKLPILKIVDKRRADDKVDKVPPVSTKKQKTARSKSTEDALLIAKPKRGEPVQRNNRQKEEFEEMCKGK